MSELMTIMLERCKFYAYHGVMPQERIAGNEFEVSVEVEYYISGLNDDLLESTLSYSDIYDIVKSEMQIPRKLLETIARNIGARVLEMPLEIQKIQVEIRKITPPIPGINGSAAVKYTYMV